MQSSNQPTCYFCGSDDSMAPFKRSDSVWLLSWILPVRWRYCRECARHFLSFSRPAARVVGEPMDFEEKPAKSSERAA